MQLVQIIGSLLCPLGRRPGRQPLGLQRIERPRLRLQQDTAGDQSQYGVPCPTGNLRTDSQPLPIFLRTEVLHRGDSTLIVKRHKRHQAANRHKQFIARIRQVPVWWYVAVWLDGIEKPLARILIVRMKVPMLTTAWTDPGQTDQFIQKLT